MIQKILGNSRETKIWGQWGVSDFEGGFLYCFGWASKLQVSEAGGHRKRLSQWPLSSWVQIQRMQFIGNKRMGSESSFVTNPQVGA